MTKALEIYEMLTKQAAMCPGVWSALNVTKVDLSGGRLMFNINCAGKSSNLQIFASKGQLVLEARSTVGYFVDNDIKSEELFISLIDSLWYFGCLSSTIVNNYPNLPSLDEGEVFTQANKVFHTLKCQSDKFPGIWDALHVNELDISGYTLNFNTLNGGTLVNVRITCRGERYRVEIKTRIGELGITNIEEDKLFIALVDTLAISANLPSTISNNYPNPPSLKD